MTDAAPPAPRIDPLLANERGKRSRHPRFARTGLAGTRARVVPTSESLHRDGAVPDETWHLLAQTLDAAELVERLSMIGAPTEVAHVVNSLRVNLMPGHRLVGSLKDQASC